jgi:hypothetical protein
MPEPIQSYDPISVLDDEAVVNPSVLPEEQLAQCFTHALGHYGDDVLNAAVNIPDKHSAIGRVMEVDRELTEMEVKSFKAAYVRESESLRAIHSDILGRRAKLWELWAGRLRREGASRHWEGKRWSMEAESRFIDLAIAIGDRATNTATGVHRLIDLGAETQSPKKIGDLVEAQNPDVEVSYPWIEPPGLPANDDTYPFTVRRK